MRREVALLLLPFVPPREKESYEGTIVPGKAPTIASLLGICEVAQIAPSGSFQE